MAELWPSGLQDIVNEEGFGYTLGDTLVRSDMDVGPAKVRRRYTKGVENLTTTINLTTSEYTTFKNFYDTTLNGGVTPFLFDHPITGVQEEFRFVNPPKIDSIGGGNFRVSMEWEKLP